MGRKFKVWLNSGANAYSCRKQIVDLDDLGMSEEWDSMSEDEREEALREVAFDRADWGFCELEDGEAEE